MAGGRTNGGRLPTHGAVLLTSPGVVPPDEFTLQAGDEVSIEVTGIGTLTNPVVCG